MASQSSLVLYQGEGSSNQCGSDTQIAKWQVKFPSAWMDLPSEVSRHIEAARNYGKDAAEYEQCRSHKQGWYDPYRIDFSTMQQQNLRSKRVREARRFIQLASHVKQEEPSEDDDLPKTTPTENDEFPRTGVWDEPKAGKKEANKMPRAPMKSATEHEED